MPICQYFQRKLKFNSDIPYSNLKKQKMKLITAYIKPFKLHDVKKVLEKIGVQGMSVSEIRGYGRQKGQSELYRGEEYEVAFLPKIRIEIATTNELAEKMIPAIIKSAQTGKVGDGKILVSDLQNVYRIRTEESGIDALDEYIWLNILKLELSFFSLI